MANEINFYRLVPQNGAQCAICFEPLNAQDVAVGHAAGLTNHIYHQVCAEPWINDRHNCPECRLQVRSIQLIAPPGQPRAEAPLSLLARQHPYILNGTVAATTAAAIGTAALQNNPFNGLGLIGLMTGTFATIPVELAIENRSQLERRLAAAMIATLFGAATLFLSNEADAIGSAMAMPMIAGTMTGLPRLFPPLRMHPQDASNLRSGLVLGLLPLMLAPLDNNEGTWTTRAVLSLFVAASCLATLLLTASRRFFGPDAS